MLRSSSEDNEEALLSGKAKVGSREDMSWRVVRIPVPARYMSAAAKEQEVVR